MKSKIFIVILHFGTVAPIKKCISSIHKARIPYEQITLVDNAGNLKVDALEEKIEVIRNRKNLGYAGGMNKGIKLCLSKGAEYILLLNNDTLIEVNFIDELREFLEKHKNVGIVSPAVKFQKRGEIIYDLGGKVNFLFGKTSHNEVNTVLDKKPRLVDYVSGCCMVVKKEVFDKVGFFDETFFLYYEDVDFCLRARKVGLETFLLPNAIIYHTLSQTVGKNSHLALYHQTLSAILFGKKHFHSIKRLFHILFILFQTLYIFLKNPVVGRSAFLGLFHGIR